MDHFSDRELRDALSDPNLNRRKRAYVRELLRRCYKAKPNAAWRKLWLSVLQGWGADTRRDFTDPLPEKMKGSRIDRGR